MENIPINWPSYTLFLLRKPCGYETVAIVAGSRPLCSDIYNTVTKLWGGVLTNFILTTKGEPLPNDDTPWHSYLLHQKHEYAPGIRNTMLLGLLEDRFFEHIL